MNRRYASIRLKLLVALSLAAASATAANPPPNFSDRIPLCGLKLNALVNITFGQSATTAMVRATSQPVKINPYGGAYTPFQGYFIRTTASVKKNASSEWSTYTDTGQGTVGVTQTPVSSGHDTFKDPNCQIKGIVYIFTSCPPESPIAYDAAQIERTWVGCGL